MQFLVVHIIYTKKTQKIYEAFLFDLGIKYAASALRPKKCNSSEGERSNGSSLSADAAYLKR